MSTASEEILARYAQIERESDTLGRLIGVRRLRPAQQMRIAELVDTERASAMAVFNIAAAVCEIDGQMIPFPRTRPEIDAIMDRLDQEGIQAASAALERLYEKSSAPRTKDEMIALGKELPGMPTPE